MVEFLDKKQIKKAVVALRAFKESKKDKTSLFEDDEFFQVSINFHKMPVSKPQPYPHIIQLKHSFWTAEDEVCIITDKKEFWKPKLTEMGAPVHKITDIRRVSKNYPSFEMKRKFRDSYSVFLVDKRVKNQLLPHLGKTFYKVKKAPIPVFMGQKHVIECINNRLSSTCYYPPSGPNSTVKVGRSFHTDDQVVENIVAMVEGIQEHVLGKMSGIKSLSLSMTNTSGIPALPFFQQLPRIAKLKEASPDAEEEEKKEEEEEEEEEEEKEEEKKVEVKGKKRKAAGKPVVATGKPVKGRPQKRAKKN